MLGANGSRISFLSPVAPNARLRPRRTRQYAPTSEDRPFEGLEILRVETLPRLAREVVEPNAIHRGDHQAPAFNHNRRSWRLRGHHFGAGIVRLEAVRAVGHQ